MAGKTDEKKKEPETIIVPTETLLSIRYMVDRAKGVLKGSRKNPNLITGISVQLTMIRDTINSLLPEEES